MTPCAVPVFARVSPAQGDVLSAIATYQRHHDCPPTLRDILTVLGHTSLNGISEQLVRLKLRGLVTWQQRKSRTLRLTGAPWVVVADKPSVVERCIYCKAPIYECSGWECGGKTVRS